MKSMLIKKICSVLLCFFMLASDLARADPELRFINTPAHSESPIPVLKLPEALGRIDKVYRPHDTKPGAPFVVYLQTVHAHPEAAQHIRKIADYLQSRYGVKLVLAEGASAQLHPEFLSFFKDARQNRRALHVLTQQGILTGADLALRNPEIHGFGIEAPEAYRAAYRQYQKVTAHRAESLAWVEQKKANLDLKASKEFSSEMRDMLQAWLHYQHNLRDFRATVNYLQRAAFMKISIDFENPLAQFEWPQLSRVAVLIELEKRRDDAVFKAEYAKLKAWLSLKKLDGHWLDLLAQASSSPEKRKTITRAGAETFLKQVWPQGFSMRDYPQTAYAVAALVLEKELDGARLTKELTRIFNKLLSASVTNENERTLLAEYKRLLLVEKLLVLELSPEQWKNVSSEQTDVMHAMPPAYEAALKFYRLMDAREKAFLENLTKESAKARASSVMLITGGFHARGMTRALRKNKISYALITPHITASADSALYRKSMLATAHLERSLVSQPAVFASRQGWPVERETDQVRQALKDLLRQNPRGADAAYFKDRIFSATGRLTQAAVRSEMRNETGSAEQTPEVPETNDFAPQDAKVTSQDARFIAVLELMRDGKEIPENMQRLTPKRSRTHGDIQIATVTYTAGGKKVIKSIAPVSHSEFKDSEVTGIIRKTGPGTDGRGEYSIGLEVTSRASGEKFIIVSYILAKDGRLRVGKLEKTNMEYDGRFTLDQVPSGAAALNKEIVYDIVHNRMPEKFRKMDIDTLRELGLITQKETAVYFWKPDTRLDIPDNLPVDKLMVRIDPVEMAVPEEAVTGSESVTETAWVASLWIDEEKDSAGNVIRPALPILDIVLYRPSAGFTVTRPHPRGRTGFQHVQGPIPDVKKTFKDLIKAHWNTYWLANGGLNPPADEIEVRAVHGIHKDEYVFNFKANTVSLELGSQFAKGDTQRSWVSFGGDKRGLRYTNSESGAEKYFLIFHDNQFHLPEEIKKPEQVTEAPLPSVAAREKIADVHEDFHPALSLEEKLLLIKERQRIWQAMEGLEKEWQETLPAGSEEKMAKLKVLQGKYEKLFQEAHGLTLVQTQADYSASPAFTGKLHYTRAVEYKGFEPRRDEESVRLFRNLMAEVVSGHPTGDIFKQLTRNFGLVNQVLRVVELPVSSHRLFAAAPGDKDHSVPLGSYVKGRIYVSVSTEQHQAQTVVRLRLYEPDHMNEPWDSLYFDPLRGSFVFSRDEWLEFFEDSEIHTAPGDRIAAHITEHGRLNLFRDLDVLITAGYSKKAFGFVNLGDALYEGMDHQEFYPFHTKGAGRRYYLKAQVIDGQKWVRVYGSPALDEASELGSFRWLGDDDDWRSRAEGGIGFTEAQSGPLAEYSGYGYRDRVWTALKRWTGSVEGEPHFHELALRDKIGTRNKVDLPVPDGIQKENPTHLSVRQGHGEKGDAVFWRTAPEETGVRAIDLYDQRGHFQERAFYSPDAPEGANALTEASRRFLMLRRLVQEGRDELPAPVLFSRPGSAKMERFELLDITRGAASKRKGTNVIFNLFKEMENAGLPGNFHSSMMWLEYGTIVEDGQTRPVLYATAVNPEQKKAYLAVRAVETAEGQFRYDLLKGGQDVSARVMPRLQELGYDRGVDSVVFPAYLRRRLDTINREIQLLQAPHQGPEGIKQFAAKGFVANLLEAARFSSFSPIQAEIYFYLNSDSFRVALTESARQLTEAYAVRTSDAEFLKSEGVLHFVAELLNQPGLQGLIKHEAWRFEPLQQLHHQIMNLRAAQSSNFSAQDRAEAVLQLARGILSGEQSGTANQVEVSVPTYVRPPKMAAAAPSGTVRKMEWVSLPEMKASLVPMPAMQARPRTAAQEPPEEAPAPVEFKTVLKRGQLARVNWPESLTTLDRHMYFGIPSETTYLRRIERLEELQRGYQRLRAELPQPGKPAAVTEPDLAATWAEYRRTLSRKPRPESALIRRPRYYDWKALEDLPAPQREFEQRLRQAILAIQLEQPQTEYFWVEMGPVLRSNEEPRPAFYVTGVDFRTGQVSRIRRIAVSHERNRFFTNVSGDQTGPAFAHPVFGAILEHGYQFYGEPDKAGFLIDKRLEQVRQMLELEQIDWDENPALENFLAIPDMPDFLAQSRRMAGGASLLLNPPKHFQSGISPLEVNFFPQTRLLQLSFALARKIAAGPGLPSTEDALRFLDPIDSAEMRELLGYQRFMLSPFSRLHFRIERAGETPAEEDLKAAKRVAEYFESVRQKHFANLVLPSTEVRPAAAATAVPEPELETDEEPVVETQPAPIALPPETTLGVVEVSPFVAEPSPVEVAEPLGTAVISVPAAQPQVTVGEDKKQQTSAAFEQALNAAYEKLGAWIELFNTEQLEPLQTEVIDFLETVPDEEDMESLPVRERFDYYVMMSRLVFFAGFGLKDSVQALEEAQKLLPQVQDAWSLETFIDWKDFLLPYAADKGVQTVAFSENPAPVEIGRAHV